MNDATRKALELARDWFDDDNISVGDVLAAINAALSAPAAPVALTDERAAFEAQFKGVSKKVHLERCGDTYFGDWAACAWEGWQARSAAPAAPVMQPAEWLRTLLDAVMDFRHTPDGMVRGGEYVRADALIEAASIAAPAAPVAREPSRDQCDQILKGVGAAVTYSNREYLRVWLRDWFAHGIGQGRAA